jgi:Excisionase from transposon Tn916.
LSKNNGIPAGTRYALTIEEASRYSLIGEGRLRRIIDSDRSMDWVLRVGSQVRIKRELFEKWLDKQYNL